MLFGNEKHTMQEGFFFWNDTMLKFLLFPSFFISRAMKPRLKSFQEHKNMRAYNEATTSQSFLPLLLKFHPTGSHK